MSSRSEPEAGGDEGDDLRDHPILQFPEGSTAVGRCDKFRIMSVGRQKAVDMEILGEIGERERAERWIGEEMSTWRSSLPTGRSSWSSSPHSLFSGLYWEPETVTPLYIAGITEIDEATLRAWWPHIAEDPFVGTKARRSREQELDAAMTNMANCLMLLSRSPTSNEPYENASGRVFECKTCSRQFTSFQALGGHRASHKKPRLNTDHGDLTHGTNLAPAKPKSHECSICGLEFSIGQALGGHMRRHRATRTIDQSRSSVSDDLSTSIVEKVISHKVFGLDLNLTPLENDFELQFMKVAPTTIELFI
ncbi:hypothetical protein E3N88_38377 [Mikania micrantha]|uniref:C2H2-type domain-containing protein n=1 Tax=Mikania micrantha TaxID=192012 RepID=A0A5N6LU29_9ASTR|nr:hypothetical protein E3N88_38377 [Mikania micrantha]